MVSKHTLNSSRSAANKPHIISQSDQYLMPYLLVIPLTSAARNQHGGKWKKPGVAER